MSNKHCSVFMSFGIISDAFILRFYRFSSKFVLHETVSIVSMYKSDLRLVHNLIPGKVRMSSCFVVSCLISKRLSISFMQFIVVRVSAFLFGW